MKTNLMLKSLSYFTFMALLFLASCQDDKIDFSANDSQNVENEAVSDAYYEDADDMSSIAVSSDATTLTGGREAAGGKTVTISDLAKRFDCATVTFELAPNNELGNPKGTITIDFGTGCTDAKGNVRKGKLIINYSGKRFLAGSTVVTTFDGYFINGVKIEGTRTVTNTSASLESNPAFNIIVTGGKATWPDATFATREVNRTRVWQRSSTNPNLDVWSVSGTASGTNRNGRSYQMEITKPLVYKRECAISDKVFIAVEGTKVLTVESKQITIDYGDGACDKLVTITVNGKSREVEVRGDI